MRNLQEQVKKAFCHQKLFWPFTVWINCSSDLKNFANSRPSASNFKSFSWSLEQFFLTVGQNNFGNKIPLMNSPINSEIKMNKIETKMSVATDLIIILIFIDIIKIIVEFLQLFLPVLCTVHSSTVAFFEVFYSSFQRKGYQGLG